MSPDVEHLLRSVHAPGFTYREGSGPSPVSARPGPGRAGVRELTIAFVSPIPGAGRTTLAAAVARALARLGLATLAVDLDPRRELQPALAGGDAPACVAIGDASRCLEALAAAPDAVVLDTPAAGVEQALAAADEVVVVLRADAASRAAVRGVDAVVARAWLRAPRRFRARYVVNQFDARRAANRGAWAALRADLGARLWPRPLQRDAAVGAARAAGRELGEVAPGSQLAADVELLARAVAGGGPLQGGAAAVRQDG